VRGRWSWENKIANVNHEEGRMDDDRGGRAGDSGRTEGRTDRWW
jgi:hypothetical protein